MGRETEEFFFLSKKMEWKVSVHIMCRKGKYCFMKILFYLHVLKKRQRKQERK